VKAFDDQGPYKKEPFEPGFFQQVRSGHRRSIARLITYVENDELASKKAISTLYADTGKAHIIGITGPPGSGKSTLVNELAKEFRQRNCLVGIVAIDPSSPFSGGALLGDRVRMQDLSGDRGIFIRSMASRGRLGGLAKMTGNVVKILDAAGFDVILIETVGAGQAEVDIASTAHTTLVIEAPGMGDEIQTIKAGILEIADILVVNKADRPGSDRTIAALKVMIHMGAPPEPVRHHGQMMAMMDEDSDFEETDAPIEEKDAAWEVPVLASIAINGEGIDEIVDKIEAHKKFLTVTGEWQERELARSRQEIGYLLQGEFMKQMAAAVPASDQEALIEAVAKREIDPYTAVNRLFAQAGERGWKRPATGER
jgi:LAO/AO transport system kinase